MHDPFANIDDMGYVYENLHVQAGLTWETIKWAALAFDDNNWHPLTWISHAVDCQLFGIDPAGHHAMTIVFHALDALVLFWVLLLATGFVGRSFMVAALFALHPINVESVAWAAERKTLLSTLFFSARAGSISLVCKPAGHSSIWRRGCSVCAGPHGEAADHHTALCSSVVGLLAVKADVCRSTRCHTPGRSAPATSPQ